MKLSQKTSFNIGITLLLIAVIVMIALVGRSAFIAGGRTACHNTNEEYVLVEGFKCEEIIITIIEIGEIPKLEWRFENGNESI